jgi:hypothetical protein
MCKGNINNLKESMNIKIKLSATNKWPEQGLNKGKCSEKYAQKENSRKNGLRVLFIQNRCAARSQDCVQMQAMHSITLMHAFDRDICVPTHITTHGARLEMMEARAG